jgi:5-enolpyruvylshikimate-3-phosphate synthase
MAMAAATLAVVAGAIVEIDGAEHVKKSFPGFWAQLRAIGVAVH